MRKLLYSLILLLACAAVSGAYPLTYRTLVPDTSIERAGDRGHRVHTTHVISVPVEDGWYAAGVQPRGGLGPGGGMTPAQLKAFYGMPVAGGSGIIAIVGAYDYATALKDFNVFAQYFGLPVETSTNATAATNRVFQVVYASGKKPSANGGWAQEAALDIEWSHAMAPDAKIVLVEAASASLADMFRAVTVARTIAGVRQVSMSWGTGEWSGQTAYDAYFPLGTGVTFYASSGDAGGVVSYPSSSQNVVSVGGTRVATSAAGLWTGETGWSGSGGGTSLYEAKPAYQVGVPGTPAAKRGVPDISADADPASGVCVYDSTRYAGMSGWMVFGGTSASCPAMAGMVNTAGTVAGSFLADSTAQLARIYQNLLNSTGAYRDITSGTAGKFKCGVGWDFVTGVGVPQGLAGL